MKLNRREFLKAVMAAAVVANVPITEAEAIEAYESLGIDDMGDGWYRCWMSFVDDGKTRTFSTFAKRYGKHGWMQLSHGRVRAYFDLRTGELGEVEIVDDYVDPMIHGSDGTNIFGAQLEES